MELLTFDYQGHRFALVVDTELRLERLCLDARVMSVKPLGQPNSTHSFEDATLGACEFSYILDFKTQMIVYRLCSNGEELLVDQSNLSDEALALFSLGSENNSQLPTKPRQTSFIVLLGVALKLFKTAKVVKVALGAASLAAYSIIFSVEFALALIAVLVVHELGHVQAMKKFGIATKGFYLIPFVGGLAIGDKARTQWESLYISMMGPVYGLFMTIVFFLIYLLTNSHFCGLVASVSALLNIFNLLPVHPLDGGQVVKALVFSRRNGWAFFSLLGISAIFTVLALELGMHFLVFFMVLGVVDLIASWREPISVGMTPLKTYGIWFSLLWYLLVIAAFLAIILLIAKANLPGIEIVTKILQS